MGVGHPPRMKTARPRGPESRSALPFLRCHDGGLAKRKAPAGARRGSVTSWLIECSESIPAKPPTCVVYTNFMKCIYRLYNKSCAPAFRVSAGCGRSRLGIRQHPIGRNRPLAGANPATESDHIYCGNNVASGPTVSLCRCARISSPTGWGRVEKADGHPPSPIASTLTRRLPLE
jgi:hypothetical protein